MPTRTPLLAVLAAFALLAGCGDDDGESGATFTVVATTPVVADLVRNVAGDRAEVRTLLRPNADPHDYEPRPSDAAAVTDADLIVSSGGELDHWLGDLLDAAGGDVRTETLLDIVRPLKDGEDSDPHWWHDPRNVLAAVTRLRAVLVAELPDDAAGDLTRNAGAYSRTVRALDRAVARCFAAIPDARRKLVTTHDALGYFARRYDLEVLGSVIPALTTHAQPSAGETARLVRAIRAAGVRAIFPESSVSARVERAIADEAGARIGGELWADTLGDEDSTGATYVEALRHNASTIAEGLSGRRCDLAH